MSQPVKYGLVVFAAIFVVGWVTGMGGSALPNFIFSVLMGLLGGGLFALAQRFNRSRRD